MGHNCHPPTLCPFYEVHSPATSPVALKPLFKSCSFCVLLIHPNWQQQPKNQYRSDLGCPRRRPQWYCHQRYHRTEVVLFSNRAHSGELFWKQDQVFPPQFTVTKNCISVWCTSVDLYNSTFHDTNNIQKIKLVLKHHQYNSALEPPEETPIWQPLDLSPQDSFQITKHLNSKIINVCCFKKLNLW